MDSSKIDDLRHQISDIEQSRKSRPNKKNIESSDVNKCFRRIIILANYRERCIQELKERLVEKEKFNYDTFSAAINKAIKYGIVDDARYAEMYCFCKSCMCRGTEGIILV